MFHAHRKTNPFRFHTQVLLRLNVVYIYLGSEVKELLMWSHLNHDDMIKTYVRNAIWTLGTDIDKTITSVMNYPGLYNLPS